MKTYKFRVWDGEKIIHFKLRDLTVYTGEFAYAEGQCVDCDEFNHNIMQFTGLKDKNDKDIYEGDIVIEKYPDEDKEMMGKYWKQTCFIRYDEDLAMFLIDPNDGLTPDTFETEAEIEVIGNIYQNPELLEGQS